MLEDHLSPEDIATLKKAQQAGSLSPEQKSKIIELSRRPAATSTPKSNLDFGLDKGPVAFSDNPEFSDISRDAGRKTTLKETTGGVVNREAFEGIGATIGGTVGVGTGPFAPAGVLAGMGLGGGLGSATFDTLEEIMRWTGALKQPEDPLDNSPFKNSLEAVGDEILFAGGSQMLFTGLAMTKPLIGKMLGVQTAEVADLITRAESANLRVGAVDVVDGIRGKIVRGASKVMGIFPYVGGPFRANAEKKAAAVVDATGRILNRLAPNAVMSDDLGINMVRASRGSMKQFTRVSGSLYTRWRNLVANAKVKNVIPTDKIKGASGLLVKKNEQGKIILDDGDVLEGPAADQLIDFVSKLQKLPDRITINQYEKLADDLQDFVSSANSAGFDVARYMGIKKSMEASLTKMKLSGLPEGQAKAILNAKKAADSFYAKGILAFQSPTAQKFGRVDKNIFKPGFSKAGNLNDDELAEVVLNLRSPKAIDDLAELVGEQNMGAVARKTIETAWNKALIVGDDDLIKGIDWKSLKDSLGLGQGKRATQSAFRRLMSKTKVKADEIENLINIASKLEVPKDVNTFIARRAALGGAGSAVAGATTMGLIKGSLLKSTGVAILLRHSAKIMADPVHLKAMTKVLAPTTTELQRRAILGRLLESLDETPDIEADLNAL